MRFHDYYLSVQIVTSRRIIDITQNGLFTREMNELSYNTIEDVNYKRSGLLATVFNFGDVILQTAAGSNKNTSGFIFKNIPYPAKVHSLIANLLHRHIEDMDTPQVVRPQVAPIYRSNWQTEQMDLGQIYPDPLTPDYRRNIKEVEEEKPANPQNDLPH